MGTVFVMLLPKHGIQLLSVCSLYCANLPFFSLFHREERMYIVDSQWDHSK